MIMTAPRRVTQAAIRTTTRTPTLYFDHVETALGPFTVVADGEGRLRAAGWTDDTTDGRMAARLRAFATGSATTFVQASNPGGLSAALAAYFDGHLAAIDRLPLADATGTPFQRAVWAALREIPCGQTRSYGDIARAIGRPSAVRAVGLANGSNPICVVVPCHRVIGANGKLVGYGGGIQRKRWLLEHEGRAALPLFSAIDKRAALG